MLTSGTVPNEIGKKIQSDILLKMSVGKMPDGNLGITNAPPLTKETKAFYKSKGVRTKARFDFQGRLKNQIKIKNDGRKIIIGPSTEEAKKKIRVLASKKTSNGGQKKPRYIMLWTKTRTNIVKKIIRDAIKRNFG